MKNLIYNLLAVFYNYYGKGSDSLIAYECSIFTLIATCYFNVTSLFVLINQVIIVKTIKSVYFLYMFIVLIIPLFYLFQKVFQKNIVKECGIKFESASITTIKLLVLLYVIFSVLCFIFILALFSPKL
jgi:hypothetical protein